MKATLRRPPQRWNSSFRTNFIVFFAFHGIAPFDPFLATPNAALSLTFALSVKDYKNTWNLLILPSGALQNDRHPTQNLNIGKEFMSFLKQCNFTIWDVGRRRILDLQDAISRISLLHIKSMKSQQKLPLGGIRGTETHRFAQVL